jgi:hypothetical protein
LGGVYVLAVVVVLVRGIIIATSASGREDARPFLLKSSEVDAPLPRSDFILQPQITIIKIDTPGA